jgi:hypothetical protein
MTGGTLISGEGRGKVLFIKIRPAPSLIGGFSSRDPAVLFLKFHSAPPLGEVSFIHVVFTLAMNGFLPKNNNLQHNTI